MRVLALHQYFRPSWILVLVLVCLLLFSSFLCLDRAAFLLLRKKTPHLMFELS